MYSIFLPFAALLLDLANAFVYLKNDFWWAGNSTVRISFWQVTSLLEYLEVMYSAALLEYLRAGRAGPATSFWFRDNDNATT